MKCRFIREQKHICGENYREIDLFPITERTKKSNARAKKRQASSVVQQNLNGSNAKRYLGQLINTNFDASGMHVTLTYDDESLPQSAEQAARDLDCYLRRVAYHNKKQGYGNIAYVAVLEYREQNDTEKAIRFHHHVILKCGLGRDFVESLWKNSKSEQAFGIVNADRLKMDRESLEKIANYLTKYTNRKRRWKQSKGLKKPQRPRPNDGKYTRRQIERIAKDGSVYDGDFWNKKYPGWELNDARPVWNEVTGEWSIYLKMRRTMEKPKQKIKSREKIRL